MRNFYIFLLESPFTRYLCQWRLFCWYLESLRYVGRDVTCIYKQFSCLFVVSFQKNMRLVNVYLWFELFLTIFLALVVIAATVKQFLGRDTLRQGFLMLLLIFCKCLYPICHESLTFNFFVLSFETVPAHLCHLVLRWHLPPKNTSSLRMFIKYGFCSTSTNCCPVLHVSPHLLCFYVIISTVFCHHLSLTLNFYDYF